MSTVHNFCQTFVFNNNGNVPQLSQDLKSSPSHNSLPSCSDFQRISLEPGESKLVHLDIAGHNLQDMILRVSASVPQALLGELHLAVESINIPLNAQCQLAGPKLSVLH